MGGARLAQGEVDGQRVEGAVDLGLRGEAELVGLALVDRVEAGADVVEVALVGVVPARDGPGGDLGAPRPARSASERMVSSRHSASSPSHAVPRASSSPLPAAVDRERAVDAQEAGIRIPGGADRLDPGGLAAHLVAEPADEPQAEQGGVVVRARCPRPGSPSSSRRAASTGRSSASGRPAPR